MKKQILLFIGILIALQTYSQSTITDVDGNVYDTITIGTQVWMKQNLKTTKYRNNTVIPNITSSIMWSDLTDGAYCDHNNTSSYSMTYGRLYNWYAIADTNKICPTGWHVPSNSEWTILTSYLGGTNIAGGKMKETDTLHWKSPNTGADNSSKFTALPSGSRISGGNFSFLGYDSNFWSSTEDIGNTARVRNLNYNNAFVGWYNGYKIDGFSVRCIRDFPSSVDEILKNNKVNIYPNPAKNTITIDTKNTKLLTISIYNLIGDCLIKQSIINQINIINIDNFSRGLYIIKLSNNSGEIIQQKFIKE